VLWLLLRWIALEEEVLAAAAHWKGGRSRQSCFCRALGSSRAFTGDGALSPMPIRSDPIKRWAGARVVALTMSPAISSMIRRVVANPLSLDLLVTPLLIE